jgi:hypothetical protein
MGGVDKELRPDRCGVIIAANMAVLDEQTVSVWEVWENASQQGDGLRIVSFMARTHAVIVTDHAGMVRVMGPPDKVDAAVAKLKASQGDSNASERDTGASHP